MRQKLARTEQPAPLRVSRAEIDRMEAAAAAIAECRREIAVGDGGLLGELAPAAGGFAPWRHYPEDEVYDPRSHAQYFFHAHANGGDAEVGHFHTFMRAEGMPPGATPLLLPETAVAGARTAPQAAPRKRGARDEVSHLVAVAVDRRGAPVRLFTTNRWVTGETWYRAEDVIAMLDRFAVAPFDPTSIVNRWLSAIVVLFRPQIAALLGERDRAVTDWRIRRRADVFEDARLEIASSADIDLEAQLAFVAGARARAPELGSRRRSLPAMAEGWGEGHIG
jgi:hypothetical protein